MRRGLILLFASLLSSAIALAQATAGSPAGSSEGTESGFTAYVQFGGSSNSSGRVFKFDPSIGYNFDRHVGVDIGVPVYFVHASDSTTGGVSSNNGVGNPYLDLRLNFEHPAVNYRALVLGYIPVADVTTGFSTGRLTGDWTNHFDHSFGRLTPFGEIGIGNTIRDSRFFDRPFTSLGFNAHMEGGAAIDLSEHFQVGASGYGIFPSGQQRVFSRLMHSASGGGMTPGGGMTGGGMTRGRPFENTTETVGTADITRDHGFSAWFGVSPNPSVQLELGYTRSVSYGLDTVSFNLGLNVGRLLRKASH